MNTKELPANGSVAKQRKQEIGSELIGSLDDLMHAVEGVGGALEYGTFRGDKNGKRLKDTPEWVRFYVAWSRMKSSVKSTPSAARSA